MSRHATGSKNWWIETGLIAASGFALAAWLWDGPIAERVELMEGAQAPATAPAQQPPRTLAEAFETGCLTAQNLQDLREGRRTRVVCPPTAPTLRDLPPEQRPFP